MANEILTEVRLLSVPLDQSYLHTVYFENTNDQHNHFTAHMKDQQRYQDMYYQRHDGVIKYPATHDKIMDCNYVMYKNAAFGDKWFYAFITKMEYLNDGCTAVHIKTDVMQTWQEEIKLGMRPCFVEREHVKDDTVGLHIQPEDLHLGEYIVEQHEKVGYDDDLYIIVGTTYIAESDENGSGLLINGIYSGLTYFSFTNDVSGRDQLNAFIKKYDEAGKGEAIQCMFLAPKELGEPSSIAGVPFIRQSSLPDRLYVNVPSKENNKYLGIGAQSEYIDGYKVDNKKLLTYPYRYLLVSNNNGGAATYNFEDFEYEDSTSQPKFVIEGCLTPGCSIRMVPLNYKMKQKDGIDQRNDEEGINLGKYPIINWSSDYYINWLTQNSANNSVSTTSGIATMIIGAASMVAAPAGIAGAPLAIAGAATIAGGATAVGNVVASKEKASLVPPQSKGNTNCGDVVTASGNNDFHFYRMSIKKQYAKVIDSYFTMFGYKVNELKIPESDHRETFWYTKTIDVNIVAPIPQEDLQEIKNCYNRGITFWRNMDQIGLYGLSNEPK